MSLERLESHAPVARLLPALDDRSLFDTGQAVVARAPGRLDVMGGIADYSGSRVCEMPLAVAAAVALQRRDDGQVVCRSMQADRDVSLPMSIVSAVEPVSIREAVAPEDAWALYAAGCLWWLLQQGVEAEGVSICIDSDVPLGGGVSSSAAVEVATMTAMCRLLGVAMDALPLAVACQAVENVVVGAPCGVMDQVTSCMGEAGRMLEILCQPASGNGDGHDALPAQVLGAIDVPAGYAFVGIHSGVRHEVSGDPYTDTRVAAFMGQKILSTLDTDDLTRGWLANVDAQRYDRELRQQLPEQMSGKDFVVSYGLTHDTVTAVNPAKTYGVRAATDHHVHEPKRVDAFVSLMKQAGDEDAMAEAGRLMLASHASYGSNAKLGHTMTDALVEMMMDVGREGGCYGAKITGGGGGGTVAALIRDDDATRQRLHDVRRQYEEDSGRQTLWFDGTSPGAAALGAVTVSVS